MADGESHARTTIEDFAAALASKEATPGGGSAAAAALALGAALVAMSARLTLTRRRYRQVHPDMERLVAKADAIRREALGLIESDARAYAELLEMYALPRESPADSDGRERAIAQAALFASRIPMVVGDLALEVIRLAEVAVTKANPHVRSDAAAGASLARSAIRISEMNIASNMDVIADEAGREELERGCHRLRGALSRADATVDGLLEGLTA